MKLHSVVCGTLLAQCCNTLALRSSSVTEIPKASVRPLFLFPNGTAAENLFVREDGSILMSMLTPSAALYYFPAADLAHPVLLYNFPASAAAYGITEYVCNTYAVLTGTFSRSGDTTNATGLVWKVDLTDFENTSFAQVSLLANMSDIGFLNGAATLDENTILAADSVRGIVYSINTRTGNRSIVLNDTSLAPNATGPVRLGVNGLAKVNDTLYFTNTNKRAVGKVRLAEDGTAGGPFETIATNVLVDDLEVDPVSGAVYVASLVGNAITYVAPDGTSSIITGSLNSTDVPGPTAIKFAKTARYHQEHQAKLFISTSGGIEYPINGTYIQGGGLYHLDVSAEKHQI